MKNISIYITAVLLSASCSTKKSNETIDTNTEAKTTITLSKELLKRAEVTIGKTEDKNLEEKVAANGIIDVPPQNLASISTPMAGYITYTSILPGSYVAKGQVLAVLEHQGYIELQQQYIQSVSRLLVAEKEYERQKELSAENVSPAKKVQQAESDFKSERALTHALSEKLLLIGLNPKDVVDGNITSKISVRSPIKGYVKTANCNIGLYVTPDLKIFEIIDIEHLHAEIKVFEKDISKVRKGQIVYFTVPSMDSKIVQANVVLIGKTFDNATRTIGVHSHFDESKYNFLLPGMYVNAQIVVNEHHANTVPEAAIVRIGEKFVVFTQKSRTDKDATFEAVPVTTGIKENGYVEILSPANIKELPLVLTGSYFIQAEISKTAEE
jgi:cobalt-zinc-cadmium efflux system membrane fusion protein